MLFIGEEPNTISGGTKNGNDKGRLQWAHEGGSRLTGECSEALWSLSPS